MSHVALGMKQMSGKTRILLVSVFILTAYWLFHANRHRQSARPTPPATEDIWSADEVRLFLGQVGNYSDWSNPELRKFLRRRWLVGLPKSKAVSLRSGDVSQVKQSTFVDRLLNERRSGFFVECGAADGESLSNSLFFETERDWYGLLVEPNPSFFWSLLAKRRNAYLVNACLSTDVTISEVLFKPADYVGGIVRKMDTTLLSYVDAAYPHLSDVRLTCFPLGALLYAIDVTHVDYLSLDVEGPELDILRTIPFDNVTIDVITVEYRLSNMSSINEEASAAKLRQIREFFHELGSYREVGILPWDVNLDKATNERRGLDVVYQRIIRQQQTYGEHTNRE